MLFFRFLAFGGVGEGSATTGEGDGDGDVDGFAGGVSGERGRSEDVGGGFEEVKCDGLELEGGVVEALRREEGGREGVAIGDGDDATTPPFSSTAMPLNSSTSDATPTSSEVGSEATTTASLVGLGSDDDSTAAATASKSSTTSPSRISAAGGKSSCIRSSDPTSITVVLESSAIEGGRSMAATSEGASNPPRSSHCFVSSAATASFRSRMSPARYQG